MCTARLQGPLHGWGAGPPFGAPVLRSASSSLTTTRATRERVLRYPDGRERRIIYPQEALVEEEDDSNAFDDCGLGWDCFGLRQQAAGAGAKLAKRQRPTYKRVNGPGARLSTQAPPAPAQPQQVSSGSGVVEVDGSAPSTSPPGLAGGLSTAAYLDSLFAAAFEGSQPEADVQGCYEVLAGCPWVLPRPVFLLASGRKDSELGGAVTLRVRVEQDAADELAQVLKNDALAKRLSVSTLKDGVVGFEHAEDADQYATLLAEEGTSGVRVAEVGSHALFRMTSDVQALVVLLRPNARMPRPYQLAAALKKQKAWDDL